MLGRNKDLPSGNDDRGWAVTEPLVLPHWQVEDTLAEMKDLRKLLVTVVLEVDTPHGESSAFKTVSFE